MRTFKIQRTMILSIVVATTTSTGCGVLFNPFADPRVTDGGGGTLVTAGGKILGNQLGSLTQDELQILSDEVRNTLATFTPNAADLPDLTNEQADAMIEFINANELNSIDDIVTVVDRIKEDKDSIVIPPSLIAAFSDSDVNEEDFDADELESIFEQVFSGFTG